jgi:tetratricopeptide (TPR) repeat protein
MLTFRAALALEPHSIEARARLGRALCLKGWQFAPPLAADEARAKLAEGVKMADEALAIDPDNAFAHVPKGLYEISQGNYPEARRIFESANLLDRNLIYAYNNLATIMVRLGEPLKTIRYAEQGLRLDPRGRQAAVLHIDMGTAHFLLGNDDAAFDAFSRARTSNPKLPRIYPGFAALMAKRGNILQAHELVSDLIQMAPNYRLSNGVDFPTKHSPPEYRSLFGFHISSRRAPRWTSGIRKSRSQFLAHRTVLSAAFCESRDTFALMGTPPVRPPGGDAARGADAARSGRG